MKCKSCGKQFVWMKSKNKFIDVDGESLSEEDIDWLLSHPYEFMEFDKKRHKDHLLVCQGHGSKLANFNPNKS